MNCEARKLIGVVLLTGGYLMGAADDVREGGDLFPVVAGERQAVIVGDDNIHACVECGYKRLPRFLQTYIEKSTGRKLTRVAEKDYDPQTMPYAIFVGNTKANQERYAEILRHLDRDSYVVDVTPKAVYIQGARRHSTYYAMADFLYRYLGIATYIPSRWGTIVPKHDKVEIAPDFRLEVPAFDSRAFSCLRTYHDTGPRLSYSGNADIPWRLYRRDTFSHNIHSFIKAEEYGQEHPEYFPERNGKRLIVSTGTSPGPCIANPDVVRIITEKVRAYFDDSKNKEKDIISLGMTDGGWCECAKCKALDGLDVRGVESKSQRYYTFLNQVAQALRESHPGKSIGVLAYAGADWPPKDIKVERNIVPYICFTRANWGDEDVKRRSLEQTFTWASRVDKLGTYEYLYGSGFMVPRLYNRHLAKYLRLVRSQGNGGFYAEIYSNHSLDGPKAWVVEKLLWNPREDPEVLLTIWCQRLFDEAAEPMREYFSYLESCNTRNITRCPQGRKGRDSKFYLLQDEAQFALFTVDEITVAKKHLAQARAATKRPEILERVEYFAQGLEVCELSVRAYHAFSKAKELHAAEASHAELLAALIEGENLAPKDDPVILLQECIRKDPSMFTQQFPVAISTATELSARIVNGAPWNAVYKLLRGGTRDRVTLVAAAQDEVRKLAGAGWEDNALAKRRVGMLLAMAERIAVARKVETPPVIDADVSDKVWQWQEVSPWWNWKSGIPYPNKAETAFCHDGATLYVALRYYQEGLAKERRSEGYGASAWKFVSSELFLNPDERDADPQEVPFYQVIPALGGGLYSSAHDVVKAWKVTDADTHWQAEMALDLAKIKMPTDRFGWLRMNLIRNTRSGGHYGRGWFPSFGAHKDLAARGWLVFE